MSRWKWALYVFLVIKLTLVIVTFRTPDGGILVDSESYLDLARAWQTQGAYLDPTGDDRDLVRPPGYPGLIRIKNSIFGELIWPITLFQLILLSSISIFLVFIGSLIERPSLGLLAGWIMALSPNSTLWSLTVMTEILFTTLIVVSIYFLFRGIMNKRRYPLTISGSLLAGAVYVRPIGLILLPAWLCLLILLDNKSGKKRLLNGLAFALTAVILVAPWFIRNDQLHGTMQFSSVSEKTWLGFNLAEVISQAEDIPRNQAVNKLMQSEGPLSETLFTIRRYPLSFFEVQLLGIARTITGSDIGTWGNVLGWDTWKGFGILSGFFQRSISYGTDPLSQASGLESWLHRGLLLYSLAFSLLFIPLSAIGLIAGPRKLSSRHLYWIVLVSSSLFIFAPLAAGQARFRVPAEPFLALLSAAGAMSLMKSVRTRLLPKLMPRFIGI